MKPTLLLIPVLLPMLAGGFLLFRPILDDRKRNSYAEITACLNSVGIRLSGPRLGRKSAAEKAEETKQIYRDGCERVAIEGEFGVVKRRYTLDHVMTKLPDTSMTSISMGFFTANMERKLRLLFAPNSDWAVKYDPVIGDVVLFQR
mgnify:CR=1 FL=1